MDLPDRLVDQRDLGRGAVRRPLPPLSASHSTPASARSRGPGAERSQGPAAALSRGPAAAAASERARRFRSPLLLLLWALLAVEAAGGLVIFFARVAYGVLPGEAFHVVAGVALSAVYAAYQWRHWARVQPFRSQLHYTLGLIAALSMALTNLTGLGLGWLWWRHRAGGFVPYPPLLSALHDIGSMLTLTFIGSHIGAVLVRDRRVREPGRPLRKE